MSFILLLGTMYNHVFLFNVVPGFFFFFLIRIHLMQGWTANIQGMELQEKEAQKD